MTLLLPSPRRRVSPSQVGPAAEITTPDDSHPVSANGSFPDLAGIPCVCPGCAIQRALSASLLPALFSPTLQPQSDPLGPQHQGPLGRGGTTWLPRTCVGPPPCFCAPLAFLPWPLSQPLYVASFKQGVMAYVLLQITPGALGTRWPASSPPPPPHPASLNPLASITSIQTCGQNEIPQCAASVAMALTFHHRHMLGRSPVHQTFRM